MIIKAPIAKLADPHDPLRQTHNDPQSQAISP
jgi:hypothetical protein